MKHRIIIQFSSAIIGLILIVVGVVMSFKKLTASGIIDIQSTILSGKIESGSLGLLFSFLGVIIIIIVLLSKIELKENIKIKNINSEIDWSKHETGDPYCSLRFEIFPYESDPPEVENIPFIDWFSEEKINEMVDAYLAKHLIELSESYLNYHDRRNNPSKHRLSIFITSSLRNILTNNSGISADLSRFNPDDIDKQLINEVFRLLSDRLEDYFIAKKRIFVGWDYFPNCYPLIHTELKIWLNNIEIKWNKKFKKIKNELSARKLNEV